MNCQCKADGSQTLVDAKTRASLEEIRYSVFKLLKELECCSAINSNDQSLHVEKIKSCLPKVIEIDDKLERLYNTFELQEEDDLESNFGVSLKLEMAKENLENLKEKHHNLNKEWHCQENHLNRISQKLVQKELELKEQSLLCTFQGFTLSQILWKFSKDPKLLEMIVANDNLAVDLVKLYSGCLYGFVRTFEKKSIDPSSNEFQFVLCLTGVFNNFATIPDGRFLLMNQGACRDIFTQIIKTIPFINLPNGEDLKFLTLSAIYNVMICKEGEKFMQNNYYLMNTLRNCIELVNSDRIILLGLKIMDNLLSNKTYVFDRIDSPIKYLKNLDRCCTSPSVRECAKKVLSLLKRPNEVPTPLCRDPDWFAEPHRKTAKSSKRKHQPKQMPITCYVVKNANVSGAFNYKKGTSAFALLNNVEELQPLSRTTSSSSSVIEPCLSFPLTRHAKLLSSGSEPTPCGIRRAGTKLSRTSDHTEKSVSCDILQVSDDNEENESPLNNLNSNESREIQSVQYQFPYTNMDKTFSITIGDNLQNPRYMSALTVRGGNYTEGEKTSTSIVTVYRISNSHFLMASDNSVFSSVYLPDLQTTPLPYNSCLKVTQGFTNILDQEPDNLPTTSKASSHHVLTKKPSISSNTSSYENFYIQKKRNKQKRKYRNQKKYKSERLVFKVPFRGRKRV